MWTTKRGNTRLSRATIFKLNKKHPLYCCNRRRNFCFKASQSWRQKTSTYLISTSSIITYNSKNRGSWLNIATFKIWISLYSNLTQSIIPTLRGNILSRTWRRNRTRLQYWWWTWRFHLYAHILAIWCNFNYTFYFRQKKRSYYRKAF